MKTRFATYLTLFILSFAPTAYAGPGAHGPNGEHLTAPTGSNASGLQRLPDGSVNVPKLAQRRMTIRTYLAGEGEHPLTVELNGKVGIDPNAGSRVQAPFAGRIEAGPQGLPVHGQRVEKGQILVHLRAQSNPIEMGNQLALLADLRANRALATQRLKRLEALEGSVPQKEIDAARSELASFSGREKALSSSLEHIEIIRASSSGVIATAKVLHGQMVEARDILFEIIDPRRLTVEAMTNDANLPSRIEQASLVGMPAVELALIGAGLSLEEGALPLQFRARVKDTALALHQPVTVIVKLRQKIKGIALPAEALVRGPANETMVWIKAGAERFIAQPVQAQVLDAKTIVVIKGLAADNRVVISGASLINQIR